MISNIMEIEKIIEYTFNNKELLNNALNHYSDNIIKTSKDAYLEFLGDSYINNYISKLLYNYRIYEDIKMYDEYYEFLKKYDFYDKEVIYDNSKYKKLSIKQIGSYYNYLRSNNFLGDIGFKLNINKYVIYNDKYPTNEIKIAANAIETITSSILLDSSYKNMYIFLNNIIFNDIVKYIENNCNSLNTKKDNKTILQEILSKRTKKYPIYKTIKNNSTWTTEIYLDNKLLDKFSDPIKKECEQKCAENIVNKINNDEIKLDNNI